MEPKRTLTGRIKAYAHSLGFDRVGVTSVDRLTRDETYLNGWLAEGRAAQMHYLERPAPSRADPSSLLEDAKCVISLAVNYYPGDSESTSDVKVARYAWGQDYHKVLGKRVESLVRYIEHFDPGIRCRSSVDTGPILERAVAQRAGLGFIGKNTMLIARGLGSWTFLAAVITTIDLDLDEPDTRSCGTCRLCLDACPTDALTAPYEMDPRRCIAYLTIESQGAMPEPLRAQTAGWVFGCDICQEVCPHNTRIPRTAVAAFGQSPSLSLAEILSIGDDAAFSRRFAGMPFLRAGRRGLVRNACVAAASLYRRDLLPELERLTRDDTDAMVREHAGWAVQRLNEVVSQKA